jgi:hypothetical protein
VRLIFPELDCSPMQASSRLTAATVAFAVCCFRPHGRELAGTIRGFVVRASQFSTTSRGLVYFSLQFRGPALFARV